MSDDEIIIEGPLGPDNFERGDRALKALLTYRENPEHIYIDDVDRLTETGDHVVIIPGSPIAYLIADLGHVCQRQNISFAEILEDGAEHYGADVVEQAWTHSPDWHNTLQHPSNIERAVSVLRTANVPEQWHDGVLRKVGLLPPLKEDTNE